MGRTIAELSDYMSTFDYAARDLIDGIAPVNLAEIQHVEDVLFTPRTRK
jgi:hypothetical protein